jgi:hypothetical protein
MFATLVDIHEKRLRESRRRASAFKEKKSGLLK